MFIFGHDPPNIDADCGALEEEDETDVDTNSLASSAQDGMLPTERMDFSENHVTPSCGKDSSNTFHSGEGMNFGF